MSVKVKVSEEQEGDKKNTRSQILLCPWAIRRQATPSGGRFLADVKAK